jgi:DNA repair protein RecO (recombination protein O)
VAGARPSGRREASLSSRFFTTEALVIGSMRYREADRIVTLYTRDRGRIGAIAKGVRRTKSKVGGRLEPFSLVRASLYSGRGLYTVVGVDTVRTFQGVRDELFRMEEGGRLVSAVRHLFPAEETSAPVFNLLVRGIARLAEAPDAAAAAGIVLAARLKLLALLGYAPEMSRCAACGAEGPLYGFSPSLGGAVCSGCAETGTLACFALSGGAQATLCTLLQSPLAEVERLDLDDRATAEVEQVLAQTLAYHGH